PPVFGGDPASARRAFDQDGRVRLPVVGSSETLEHLPIEARTLRAGATLFAVRAPNLSGALAALAPFVGGAAESAALQAELDLDDYAGLREALREDDAFSELPA